MQRVHRQSLSTLQAPGGGPVGGAPAPEAAATDACIVEVNESNFQALVVQASIDDGPVMVDFTADWCNPCKAMTPKLEKAVLEAGGTVRLAKCDIDANPQLAQAFQVQSIPHVVVIYQGKLLHQWSGAKNEEEIDELITQYEAAAGKSNPKRQLAVAHKALEKGELLEAQAMFTAVSNMAEGEAVTMAQGGLALCAAASGDLEGANKMLDALGRKSDNPTVQTAVAKVDLMLDAQQLPSTEALRAVSEADLESLHGLSVRLFTEGAHSEAIDTALKLVKRPKWREEGKALVLRLVAALGDGSPLASEARKKLGRALFN